MADTNDTVTRVVPQDGWSPIICHKVPITQTITNIVGDKGPDEIYEDGFIKNFHAKIHVQDQYGGSRVPADIITESSTDNGETWTMNEVQEHYEGDFELDYEGHERDFEVRINKGEDSEDIPFCFPSEPNEQVEGRDFYFLPTPSDEFIQWDVAFQIHIGECNIGDSADGCLSCLIFTEYDKEDTGLDRVGEGWVDADASLITSGVPVYYVRTEWVDDYTRQIIAEVQQIVSSSGGSDPSLYIRYRWMMNGQEIIDTDGSLERTITVTDYPTGLEVDAHYEDNFGGHEIGEPVFNSARVTMKSGVVKDVDEDDLIIPESTVEWADKDGWQSQTWSYTENGRTVTAQVGARITALRDVKIEASLGEDSPFKFFDAYTDEGDTYYFYLIATPPSRFIHPDEEDDNIPTATYRLTGETMGDQLRFAMLGDDRYENLGLKGKWFTYTFTSNELDDKTAYWTDLNGDDEDMVGSNLSSSIFKEGIVVTKDDLTVTMTRNDDSTYEATDYWMPNNYALGRGKQSVTVQKGSLSTTLPVTVAYSTKVEVGDIDEESEEFVKSSFYEYGEYVEPTHYNVHYECYDGTEGFDEVSEIDDEWEDRVEEETLGEYGSEVGTLTLGSKKYLYRVGLEPIDEKNYLFIKDFKDIPFNYGLVNCYEPQWEELKVGGGIDGWGTPVLTVDMGENGKTVVFEIVTPSSDVAKFEGAYLATSSKEITDKGLKNTVQILPKSWFESYGYDVTSIEESKFYALLMLKDGKMYDSYVENELESSVLYYIDLVNETVTDIQVEFA